ncbi:hypothetical protein [Alicyclobacillus vulcanalis]|uniref:hypothetical protein n=1 Tax=Alicyclobacillus vulcanalis TaxID=252246 RepID=UPI001F21DECF|nr:hypothetical protein [Alicyclobacillus vulcanalis]
MGNPVGGEHERSRLSFEMSERDLARESGGSSVHKARRAKEEQDVGARRHDVCDIVGNFACFEAAEIRVQIQLLTACDPVEARLPGDVQRHRDHVFARPAVRT